MQPFAPLTEAQFQYVAMGKARGFTWDTLATQLNLPLVVLECLPWTHEKLWNRHLTKAERLVARETITEVADVLRRDVRHAEPHLHAPLANSLSRLLKLQQDFAPPRRLHAPNAIPAPITPPLVTPTPTPSPTPATTGPSLGATVASLLGFFVLLAALCVACWKRVPKAHERADFVTCEPRVTLVAESASHDTNGPATRLILTPPPWVRES